MTTQTNYLGAVFVSDPTAITQQMSVNADGSINLRSSPAAASSTTGGNQTGIGGAIATANTYQLVAAAGAATHGGLIENTSATATNLIYVDWTAAAATATTTLTNGAAAISAPVSTTQAGGKQQIPPTSNAVYVYGPVGATFRGSCS